MSNFWRPERRNRNIGTSRSGVSKSNDMRIPESWQDKHGNLSSYYERIETACHQDLTLGDHRLTVFYEQPREGFSYGCTPADVFRLLGSVPDGNGPLPDIVVFRQPTRKQQQQRPVWGRALNSARIGAHSGPAIILEAQDLGAVLTWPKRMTMEDRAEFDRLRADGHAFVEKKRRYEAKLLDDAVRNTILYRTLLHELGHLAQYHRDVLNSKTAPHDDLATAQALHFSKPSSQRETFADAFTTDLGRVLRQASAIPFEPLGL